jgi:hypothetical protein
MASRPKNASKVKPRARKTKARARRLKAPVRELVERTDFDEAHLEGLIVGTIFRRDEQRADQRAERGPLAHTAREIAAYLQHLAVTIEHMPLDEDEHARYRDRIGAIGALTSSRPRLPKVKPKMADEPFTLAELRAGPANALASQWATWTQFFNRREFSDDRENMLAVTRCLKALSRAFWARDLERPTMRDHDATSFLTAVGERSRAYLRSLHDEDLPGSRGDDIVIPRVDLATTLLNMFVHHMREPFFVWSAPEGRNLLGRLDPTDAQFETVAEKLATSLLECLSDGWGFTEMRADLPRDFASAARKARLTAVLREQLLNFDPGSIDQKTMVGDFAPAYESALDALRAALRAIGYPAAKVKSLFDAARKADGKGRRKDR